MKTITFKNENGQVVVTTGEETPAMPTNGTSVNHSTPLNRKWSRNLQISNEFIFLKRYGCPAVGMHVDDFVALAIAAEPGLSWPPIFTKFPQSVTIKKGETATIMVEVAVGELQASYQWQFSLEGNGWTDIEGQTSPTIFCNIAGQYRCVATNGAGSTTTEPAILTATN